MIGIGSAGAAPKRSLESLWVRCQLSATEDSPINPAAGRSLSFFALHAAAYFLYYAGWEFYFRGFLLFGLRDSLVSG